MPPLVSTGAMIKCSMAMPPGAAPLTVVPMGTPVMAGTLAANVQAFAPMVNVPTFGACMSPANPTVASATAAAMGVLTPMPCLPVTSSPWMPGATKVMVDGQPALHAGCTTNCAFGGVITILSPGNKGTVEVN